MSNIGWADFITAVQIQLTNVATYAFGHNPIFQVNYDLRPYGVTDWDGVTGRLTGNFLTDAGDFGSLWKRVPSNGNTRSYIIVQIHSDHTSFENFGLTKTDLELFSIAPNTITSGMTDEGYFGYFNSTGAYTPVSASSIFRDIVEAKLGVKTTGSTSSGRTHTTAGVGGITRTLVDAGSIQEYLSDAVLNLGFGGATDLGTGTGNTPSPYFDTGTGISIMANARKKKRDYLW